MMNQARTARYRQRRDRALAIVTDIDAGWTFFEAVGTEALDDVTAARRSTKVKEAEMSERLAVLLSRRLRTPAT